MYSLLIVDDEQEICEGLMHLMPWTQWGFYVKQSFSSGEDAIAYLQSRPVDIILLDIIMDGMTGLDVVRWINEHKPSIRIVLLSGHSDFKYAHDAIHYGVRDYLLKPTDIQELQNVFRSIRLEMDQQKKIQASQSAMLQLIIASVMENRPVVPVFTHEQGARYALAVIQIDGSLHEENAAQYLHDWDWPEDWRVITCVIGRHGYIYVQAKAQAIEDELKKRAQTQCTKICTLLSLHMQVEIVNSGQDEETALSVLTASEKKRDLVERVMDMMNLPDSDLSQSLVSWAGKINTHPNYLSRCFRAKTGMTLSQYYTNLKMQRAQDYLANTDLEVSKIGMALGYYDNKYFSRVFKACFQCTPTQYRSGIRGK